MCVVFRSHYMAWKKHLVLRFNALHLISHGSTSYTTVMILVHLFFYRGIEVAYLLLYVDYILLTTSFMDLMHHIISLLASDFAMKNLGDLSYYLGITTTCDKGIFLFQHKYVLELLERTSMQNCNPCRTPVGAQFEVGPSGSPVLYPTLYCSLAGGLKYLTFTRLDLSYVMHQICLFVTLRNEDVPSCPSWFDKFAIWSLRLVHRA